MLQTLQEGLTQIKRRLLNWRGDGVHSPYAFDVIRNVIRQPHPYTSFPHLYRSQEAEVCRHRSKDKRLWTKRKHLELLFRLVHHHQAQRIFMDVDPQSLVPRYVEATGYGGRVERPQDADLIVVEHRPLDFMMALSSDQEQRLCIIINTSNEAVARWAKETELRLAPPIIFEVVGMQVWIWRRATTAGRYPVYY